MATQRYISTSFWTDKWIRSLDPSERYLYMYLLTNPMTNIAGIYPITMDRIAFDTGYDERTLRPMLKRFETSGKLYYFDDEYVVIPAWPRHQNPEKKPTIKTGIDAVLKTIPKNVLEYAVCIGYQYRIVGYQYKPSYLDLDSDLDLDIDRDIDSKPAEKAEEPARAPKVPEPPKARIETDDTGAPHFACVMYWYKRLAHATATTVQPDERDNLAGRDLLASLGGDTALFNKLTDYFFDNWRDVWFAREKDGRASFAFRRFASNAKELIPRIKPVRSAEPKSWSTAAPDKDDEPLATPEQMAKLNSLLAGGFKRVANG
jgi:hypothetical protein